MSAWGRRVDVESLKLFSSCPDRLESHPTPFNPLMLHHMITHKQNTLIRLLWTHLTTRHNHLEVYAQLAVAEVKSLCVRANTWSSLGDCNGIK